MSGSLIFLPGALDLRPNAKTALPTRNGRARRLGNESERLNCFPDAQDGFPSARVSRMAARELSRAPGNVSEPPGFLDGRPDRNPGARVRWMAVRERSNSIGELKNGAGSRKRAASIARDGSAQPAGTGPDAGARLLLT